ncbi:response regulator [Paenibacillus sp. LjRoot153]|uniref:response regulator transcription factor n=1 Tax=Paenibacillus sp. LjRoot153 TaxID=3342270 RepID=UPI003ECEE513
MYKLLIVEDEPLIRAGLQHYFDWTALGVTTIVEAENGKEGCLTALHEQPDLIITDIRMPEMDGLQMIEHIRATRPDTLFIILTGFNDFEYAQKAIRLGGVHAFLLKPLEYEESFSTIQSCMSTLKQRRNEQLLRTNLEQQANENQSFKSNHLVKFLLEDEHAAWEEGVSQQLSDFRSKTIMYQPFVVTWLPPNATQTYERKEFRQRAERIIQSALDTMYDSSIPSHLFLYIDRTKCYAIALMDDRTSSYKADHVSLPTYDSCFFIAIGKSTTDSSQLTQLLRQTDQALYQRYYHVNRQLFLPNETNETHTRVKDTRLLLEEADRNRLISGLESGNKSDIELLMHRLATDLRTHMPHTSLDRGFAFIQEIISTTIRFAHRNGIPVEGVYSEKLIKLTCVDDFPTLDALFSWLAAWMVQVSEMYRDEFSSTNHQDVLIFEHIEAYIKEHIDQDITLQMVADRFFYNPSYLSRIFKRKLDKNYMRFVTEIRIHYAQECLKKPEYLVTDVCTMCGYKSYKHFVKTFRSITNMTPTDYRKKWGW